MVKWKPKRDEIKMPTDSGATGAQSCQVIKTCWNCSLAMERLGLRLGLCSVVLFEFVSSQTFGERFGATRILVRSHCRLHGSLQSLPTRILVAPNLSVVNVPYMAKGMQKYEALYMVTVFQGSNIVSNSLSALIILQKMDGAPWWKLLGYIGCIAVMIGALWFLVSGEEAVPATNWMTICDASFRWKKEPRTERRNNARSPSQTPRVVPPPFCDPSSMERMRRSSSGNANDWNWENFHWQIKGHSFPLCFNFLVHLTCLTNAKCRPVSQH